MGPMKKYVLLLFLGINQGAYFKHIEKMRLLFMTVNTELYMDLKALRRMKW